MLSGRTLSFSSFPAVFAQFSRCPGALSREQANTHVFLKDVYGMFCSTLSNLQIA